MNAQGQEQLTMCREVGDKREILRIAKDGSLFVARPGKQNFLVEPEIAQELNNLYLKAEQTAKAAGKESAFETKDAARIKTFRGYVATLDQQKDDAALPQMALPTPIKDKEEEKEAPREVREPESTLVLTVEGMTCKNCVAHVEEEIGNIDAVATVEVILETGLVTVTAEPGQSITMAAIKKALGKDYTIKP